MTEMLPAFPPISERARMRVAPPARGAERPEGRDRDATRISPAGGGLVAGLARVRAAIAQARAAVDVIAADGLAEGLRGAAIAAGDRSLEVEAAELRIHAQRRLGQMLEAERAAGRLVTRGRRSKSGDSEKGPGVGPFSLKDVGVTKNMAAAAAQLAALEEERFSTHLDDWRVRAEAEAGRVSTRLLKSDDKRARRAAREAALAQKVAALPEARFGVILADPEWRFETRSEAGKDRAADNHYPTSCVDAICARRIDVVRGDGTIEARGVDEIAADDAALFLWTTAPHLALALEVMRAWGFSYRSHLIWHKLYPGDRQGTGYWFRVNHELLLVGVRGRVPAPAPGDQWGSVFASAPGRHSEKPCEIYDLVEEYFPNTSKLELNARAHRPGWTSVIHDPDAGQQVIGPDGASIGVLRDREGSDG